MALQLARNTAKGVPASYHILGPMQYDPTADPPTLDMLVYAYYSADVEAANGDRLDTYSYHFDIGAEPGQLPYDTSQPINAQLYAYLQMLPEWAGAVLVT